jgi:hypothetical protein
MGTVKRVQKLLLLAEKRFNNSMEASKGEKGEKSTTGPARTSDKEIEEVVLKGTGRAIEKVVTIAVFLQTKDEFVVRLKAGSVSVVDDIEKRAGSLAGEKRDKGQGKRTEKSNEKIGTDHVEGDEITNGDLNAEDSDEESAFETATSIPISEKPPAKPKDAGPMPATRIRNVSMLEAGITLKSILRYEQGRGKRDTGYPLVSS